MMGRVIQYPKLRMGNGYVFDLKELRDERVWERGELCLRGHVGEWKVRRDVFGSRFEMECGRC